MLMSSLFIYKLAVLPKVPDDILVKYNQAVIDFLWAGKKPKISLDVLQCEKKQGGLGLTNLQA